MFNPYMQGGSTMPGLPQSSTAPGMGGLGIGGGIYGNPFQVNQLSQPNTQQVGTSYKQGAGGAWVAIDPPPPWMQQQQQQPQPWQYNDAVIPPKNVAPGVRQRTPSPWELQQEQQRLQQEQQQQQPQMLGQPNTQQVGMPYQPQPGGVAIDPPPPWELQQSQQPQMGLAGLMNQQPWMQPYTRYPSMFQGRGAMLNQPMGANYGIGSLTPGNYMSQR